MVGSPHALSNIKVVICKSLVFIFIPSLVLHSLLHFKNFTCQSNTVGGALRLWGSCRWCFVLIGCILVYQSQFFHFFLQQTNQICMTSCTIKSEFPRGRPTTCRVERNPSPLRSCCPASQAAGSSVPGKNTLVMCRRVHNWPCSQARIWWGFLSCHYRGHGEEGIGKTSDKYAQTSAPLTSPTPNLCLQYL